MTSIDELCALGFERYWVNQALELTNHNKEYALEWLLSDEFKLARQQFNEQKKKFKARQTPKGLPMAGDENVNNDNNNPLLQASHNKEPSLQESNNKLSVNNNKEEELEIEYNLNQPDLKPKKTLTDFKKIGIDHLLEGSDSDDSDGIGLSSDKPKKKESDDPALNNLLNPNMGRMDRGISNGVDDEQNENDEDMQNFLQKLKNQVNKKEDDWLCHSCGVEVKADLNECHMCNAVRPGETDWICNVCTFVNDEDDAVCQMCLSEKPIDGDALKENMNRISFKAEQTWSCESCQYHNTKTNCCRMCGFVLGNEVTPQHHQQNGHKKQEQEQKVNQNQQDNGDNEEDNVLLELARVDKKPKVIVSSEQDQLGDYSDPKSPSKHISANSGKDVFDDLVPSWDSKEKKKNIGGGQMMVMREKKKKKEEEEEQEEEEEEEEFEESSIEEVVGGMDVVAVSKENKLADANDDENDDIMAFNDFDIPMMDKDHLNENADVINIQKTEVYADAMNNGKKEQSAEKPKEKEEAKAKEPELSGIELLKSMYAKDEKKNTKIKLKLRVGTVVDIYSSSRQDWVEGIIKEIKGDLICIVYGKHMKWLKKNSRQLRPKAQQVKAALQHQAEPKQDVSPQQKPKEPIPPKNDDVQLVYGDDAPPPAYAEPEFQPPPPSDPPPAFAMDQNANLVAPLQPDHFLTPKVPRKPPEEQNIMAAAADEFDYDVTFTTSVLGLELYPDREGKNCIVGKCLSKTSKKFVDPSSTVVAVNDMWVAGMSYDMVRDAIKQAAKYPPLKIQFRVKMNNIGKKKNNVGMNERGYLKVKVVAGVQLKHRASYCVVQVGNARLSTREVPRDEHPEWQEMLTFKNFRPDNGKKAIVTVYDHSTILKDKKIGTTEYEIPTQFNKLQRDTLELKSSKGKLSGVIILNTIIVHKSNSIRHLRKY